MISLSLLLADVRDGGKVSRVALLGTWFLSHFSFKWVTCFEKMHVFICETGKQFSKLRQAFNRACDLKFTHHSPSFLYSISIYLHIFFLVYRLMETLKKTDPELIQMNEFNNEQLLGLTINLPLLIRFQVHVTKILFQS